MIVLAMIERAVMRGWQNGREYDGGSVDYRYGSEVGGSMGGGGTTASVAVE